MGNDLDELGTIVDSRRHARCIERIEHPYSPRLRYVPSDLLQGPPGHNCRLLRGTRYRDEGRRLVAAARGAELIERALRGDAL
jgi:hypothetical protein